MRDIKPHSETRALTAIKFGCTCARIEQNGDCGYFVIDPGAPWGYGVYALNIDGTLGECIHFNYDSSD